MIKYFEEEDFKEENSPKREHMNGGEFVGCSFEGIDFTEWQIHHSKFLECEFKNCNLSNVTLLGTSFRDVCIEHSKLVGVNFSNCNSMSQVQILHSLLNYSVFQGLNLVQFQALDCQFREADFSQSQLKSASFQRSDLLGASFSGADLTRADLCGATNYDIDPEFTKIKKAKFSMPEAMALLKSFEIEIH